MSAEPLVYVIIVNWNGKQITLDCLDSLGQLTYKRVKTIVVDNASHDGSVAAIKTRFPDVVVLEMNENLRFAGGTNAGIRYGLENEGELFLLLNNDTTVDRELLSTMVRRMVSSTTIGAVAPKIYYHDEPNRIWFAGGVLSLWTGTMRHIGIRETDIKQYDVSRDIEYTTGCCLLTKRQVLDQVGLLDESYTMYAEDADWSMRVRRAGYSIIYEPTAKVWHKLSVSSGGHISLFKMKHKFMSNLKFFFRYAAWYQWLVFPWANVLMNGVAALKYLFAAGKK